MTLHKKSEEDFNNNKKQDYKVFTYICKSIGEELNVNRFDTPDDNDLHNAVIKYNSYKNLKDKNNIQEPFKNWFETDGKMKLLSIDSFTASENWNIDNFWSDEEKITLGFKEADSVMTLDEFKSFCSELINDISNYMEAIECLKLP